MKTKHLLVAAAIGLVGPATAQISTFPWTEDFEADATCPTGCGSACATPLQMINVTGTDDLDWLTDVNGTSSSQTGPTANGGADHNPGVSGGKYMYVETSCSGTGYSNKVAILESPVFDFSAESNIELSFWYHAYGGTQGPLLVDIRQGSGAWTNILGPIQDNQDLWQNATICIPQAFVGAGNDTVQFRFHYTSGTSFTGDIAIDDITVSSPANVDVEVTSISAPGGCGLTTTEPVSITICNQGADSLTAGTMIPVSYTVNGGTAVTEMFTLPTTLLGKCAGGGCESYTFTGTADLSVPGSYNFVGWSSMPGDSNLVNRYCHHNDDNNSSRRGASILHRLGVWSGWMDHHAERKWYMGLRNA